MTRKLTLRFLAVGAVCVSGLAVNTVLAQNTSTTQPSTQLSTPPPPSGSRPISDSLAYTFFQNYHQSNTPSGSQAPLRNKGQAISQFYADEATLIDPLKAKAKALNKEFLGLSAIPAYNDIDSTYTLIWVAVVDADPGIGVEPELMLPDNGDIWTDYIYDYSNVCPFDCSLNSSQLWNKNWTRK